MTSVALMKLWEQGAFQLDDPLEAYLPEFAAMTVLNADAAGPEDVRPAKCVDDDSASLEPFGGSVLWVY